VLVFLLSQSTINPVDAVYQPSPLEQSVISTMPSQAVIPPGMAYRKNLSRNVHEQSRMQLQSRWRGRVMVDSFCVTSAVQVHAALGGARTPRWCKGRERSGGAWSFLSHRVNLPLVLWVRWCILLALCY